MTKTRTITDDEIEALMHEAGVSGDEGQVSLCELALGLQRVERILGVPVVTQAEARAECARVIADAHAQEAD